MSKYDELLFETGLHPESDELFVNLSRDEIIHAYLSKNSVTGIVLNADVENEVFWVQLGYSIVAKLPFQEALIQKTIPLTFQESVDKATISMYSRSILGTKIKVQILSYTSDEIILTRIPLLTQAFTQIEKMPNYVPIKCTVLSISKKYVFVDCGNGLIGSILVNDLSVIRYVDIKNWIFLGDTFYATLLSVDSTEKRISLSRKNFCVSMQNIHKLFKDNCINMYVVRVGSKVPNGDGYYAELNPGCAGIVNSKKLYVEGQYIIAIITKITEDPRKPCGFRIHLTEY